MVAQSIEQRDPRLNRQPSFNTVNVKSNLRCLVIQDVHISTSTKELNLAANPLQPLIWQDVPTQYKLGGGLEIRSNGHGTVVTATVPFQEPEQSVANKFSDDKHESHSRLSVTNADLLNTTS